MQRSFQVNHGTVPRLTGLVGYFTNFLAIKMLFQPKQGLAAPGLVAAEVVAEDLIVQGSQCVGVDCIDGESFGFDTLRLKSPAPQILFDDTSSSGGFPSNDWRLSVTDDGTQQPAMFYLRNETTGFAVLRISPAGDVALGAGSELHTNAVSVGRQGNERRITHVADAIDDNDAVNLGQFQDFQTQALSSVQTEVDDLDSRITDLQNRLGNLIGRIESLESAAE